MADMEMNVPAGWRRKQVVDFAVKMRSGGTPKSDNPSYYNGEIPFVSIEDLTSANKYLDKTQKHITKAGLDNSSAWLVPENTLLYSIYATLGVPRITTIEAATNQAILGIIPDPKQIDLEFLFYLLLEKRQTILAHSSHTTQSNLNAKIVKELEFVFPQSTAEQRQIARILSKVDEAISQTEQLIAKYLSIKTGLMQDLLTKGIDKQGNIRSEETHAFKDSPLGRIPAEWEVETLEGLLDNIPDNMRSGPFGSALTKSEWVESGIPYLGIDNVQKERFVQVYNRHITPKKYSQLARYSVKPFDVMITIMGTVGRSCVVPEGIGQAISSKHVWTMSFDRKRYFPELISYQLNYSPWVLKAMREDTQGGVMPSINSQLLKKLKFPVPPISEQKLIAKKYAAAQAFLGQLNTSLEKSKNLKTGLMQDLLSGKVRVEQLIRRNGRRMNLSPELVATVQRLIAQAQERAVRAVDAERVQLYWHIGQAIVEEEQHGADRAAYGTFLVQGLAEALQPQFGSGFSRRQLYWYVQFYRAFPIVSALRTQFSWTHYKTLISLDNNDKREFYLAEAAKNNWSARQLERQVNSQLFERLLLSNDVAAVLAVARQEKTPTDARSIIKDPMVLEFLGLKREAAYYERDLETALITHLQEFMLELGNGFSFVARQQRLHLDGDDFFVDLVFYNRLLQCFVLIEIKTDKLTHQDLGQLQMYVNYYDRLEKLPHENSTIGILLCADKNDAVVKISLPADNQTIVASKYQLYLPTEQALLAAVQEEIDKLSSDNPPV